MRTILRLAFIASLSVLFIVLPPSATAETLTVQLTNGDAKPLENAVVSALPKGTKTSTGEGARFVIDQINRQFVPFISVVQTGTAISFPNKDNIRHHVYSFSPPKLFDLRLYSGVPSKPVIFDKPGLVVLGCNIHDQMVAYVQVVDTPWFALSNSAGSARITNLPPGDYEVRIWHYRSSDPNGETVRNLKIGTDQQLNIRLQIKPETNMPATTYVF